MKIHNAIMKIYPVEERKPGERWSEHVNARRLTIKVMDGDKRPDKEEATLVLNTMLELGYGAIDYNTYGKEVHFKDLRSEQMMLTKFFMLEIAG